MAKTRTTFHIDHEFEYGFTWGGDVGSRPEEEDYLARYSVIPGRAAGRISPPETDTVEIGDILRYEAADPFAADARGEPVAVDEALRDEIADWLIDNRQEEMFGHAVDQMRDMNDDAADAMREHEERYGAFGCS
ncbi:hypothetical protein [Paracoccus sp. ME4]|uniref:hypothetical protein n=1 Tax=Paracoccus sp. ME4 TaxID=3138066 RepID=UPI00398B286B